MYGDSGQTVGIYIVAMAALFFLAFAYFAVGQAAVKHNSAQTAADAAALAAARTDRDLLHDDFLTALLAGNLDALGRLLTGAGDSDTGAACDAAQQYADANDSTVDGCGRAAGLPPDSFAGWTVSVRTNDTIGNSVVNGNETRKGQAEATAVVTARCTVRPGGSSNGGSSNGGTDAGADAGATGGSTDGGTSGTAGGTDGGTGGGSGGNGGTSGGSSPPASPPASPPPPSPVTFDCLGAALTVDPAAPDFTLHLSDFYSVHLIK